MRWAKQGGGYDPRWYPKVKRDDLIAEGHERWAKAKGKAADAASMTKEEVKDFIRFLYEEGKDLKDRVGKDVHDTADEVAGKAAKAADHVRRSTN